MTKPETNIKCVHCGHQWFTESKLLKVNCPSCRKTVTNTTIKKCEDCKKAAVTCECLECGKQLCEFCFDNYHKNGLCKK